MTTKIPARQAWTPEEDARIVADAEAGLPRAATARTLNRDLNGVFKRIKYLRAQGVAVNGIAYLQPGARAASNRKGMTERPCMCCSKPFLSAGPHNRLCNTCRHGSLTAFDAPVSVLR